MYKLSTVPETYDPLWLQQELMRLQDELASVNSSWVILAPQAVEPQTRPGMVVNADGINWNPGEGSGLYEYVNSTWRKL
jgi:hypothetical protein